MKQRDEWKRDYERVVTTGSDLDRIVRLSSDEKEAVEGLKTEYPVKVSRHYLSLLDPNNPNDPLRKIVIPTLDELVQRPGEHSDDVHADEARFQPCPGIIHRYPGKILLMPTLGCPSHCRFCFRKGHKVQHLSQDEADLALDYIRGDGSIRDVIITGGEPLFMGDEELEFWVSSVRAIEHVQIIRITSRAPIYVPTRITQSLVDMLAEHRPIYLTFSFLHPRELTPELEKRIKMMGDAGIVMLQQGPLLKGINDDPEVLTELYERLAALQVLPYYAIWGISAPGTEHFMLDGQRASEIMATLENRTSGFCVPHLITIARGDKVRMMGWSPDKAAAHLRNRLRTEVNTPLSTSILNVAPHE